MAEQFAGSLRGLVLALGIVPSRPGLAVMGKFHGKAGQAPHCWAVPRALVRAVAFWFL